MPYDYFNMSCMCPEPCHVCFGFGPAPDLPLPPAVKRIHPPLPESDDEDAPTMHRVPTATSISEDYIPLPPYPSNDNCIIVTAELKSEESWRMYRKQIGYLSKFPHITAEAECILDCFVMRNYMDTSVERLISTIEQMKKAEPSNMFARSLEDSVRWHLCQMEKAGLIEIE
jgi:hypothetical protein